VSEVVGFAGAIGTADYAGENETAGFVDAREAADCAEVDETGFADISEVVGFAGAIEAAEYSGAHGRVGFADAYEAVDVAEVRGTVLETSASHQTVLAHCMHCTQQRAVCPASDSMFAACLPLSEYVLL